MEGRTATVDSKEDRRRRTSASIYVHREGGTEARVSKQDVIEEKLIEWRSGSVMEKGRFKSVEEEHEPTEEEEELLAWAILPRSATTSLSSSTQTVRALVKVEAFALRADDLN
ncbi:cyclic nucleotide-gated channel [Striga asiatica]|uniref:Cyclic nucleotide-gated channel n=1 Tax=Striga asiatica TaxID=4170 RepID=A0A5A7PME0_STRAF|nr:cyclic nucleotide-gated channel [Striga asiatica]